MPGHLSRSYQNSGLAYSILHYFMGVNFGFRSISVIDNWPIVQSLQRFGAACVNSKQGHDISCPYEGTKESGAGLGQQNRVSRRLKAPLP